MKKLLLSLVLVLTVVTIALAASADGVWKGLVEGTYNISLTLKTEGTKLTGDFALVDNNPKSENPDEAGYTPFVAAQMGKNKITDGKVDGDNISFTTTFNGKPVNYKGTIADGKLVLTTTFNNQPVKLTLRQPAAK
jgi:archaellum component FlaG (FlaF/FlaG flagellin family)